MSYAQIIFDLPLDGPFDYAIPRDLSQKVKEGSRVWVFLGARRLVGYVYAIAKTSSVKNTKPITSLIDDKPIAGSENFLIAEFLSDYYGCSLGQALAIQFPEQVRNGKQFHFPKSTFIQSEIAGNKGILLHWECPDSKWDFFTEQINSALKNGLKAIFIAADKFMLEQVKTRLSPKINNEKNFTVGTRSQVFTRLEPLGLIIVDQDENFAHKQEQSPHYHTREVAIMRSNLTNSQLIIASRSPSLESWKMAKDKLLKYIKLSSKLNKEIKIINPRNPLQTHEAILAALTRKEKVLLVLNRSGFATQAYCHNCGFCMTCPRCNVKLILHHPDNMLRCHYCNFKQEAVSICPKCQSGYIKYSGTGTEKLESEMARIFPQAKVVCIKKDTVFDQEKADIFISTESVLSLPIRFKNVFAMAIDFSLNYPDFRAAEKTYGLLCGLLDLTNYRLYIQTTLPQHHVIRAILEQDPAIFYDEELKQRDQAKLPPYLHLGILRIRGKNETRVKETAEEFFKLLNSENSVDSKVEVAAIAPSIPPKKRGSYHFQILLKAKKPQDIVKFIKTRLQNYKHSGIMLVLDIDPI